MCCYVTDIEGQDPRGSTILRENQYFDSEGNFCRVYSEDVLYQLEQLFVWNRISYFIREENTSLFSRLFGLRRHAWVIRINANDMEYAIWLVEEMRGVEIICEPPVRDWSPAEAKRRREEYGLDTRGFRRRYEAGL